MTGRLTSREKGHERGVMLELEIHEIVMHTQKTKIYIVGNIRLLNMPSTFARGNSNVYNQHFISLDDRAMDLPRANFRTNFPWAAQIGPLTNPLTGKCDNKL